MVGIGLDRTLERLGRTGIVVERQQRGAEQVLHAMRMRISLGQRLPLPRAFVHAAGLVGRDHDVELLLRRICTRRFQRFKPGARARIARMLGEHLAIDFARGIGLAALGRTLGLDQ